MDRIPRFSLPFFLITIFATCWSGWVKPQNNGSVFLSLQAILQHTDDVVHGAFSPHGNYFLTVSKDGTAKLWHRSSLPAPGINHTGELVATLEHGDSVNHGTFSPDGEFILTCSNDNTAKLWRLSDILTNNSRYPEPVITLEHDGDVNHCTFSPDGTLILTNSTDTTARLWRLSDLLALKNGEVS